MLTAALLGFVREYWASVVYDMVEEKSITDLVNAMLEHFGKLFLLRIPDWMKVYLRRAL